MLIQTTSNACLPDLGANLVSCHFTYLTGSTVDCVTDPRMTSVCTCIKPFCTRAVNIRMLLGILMQYLWETHAFFPFHQTNQTHWLQRGQQRVETFVKRQCYKCTLFPTYSYCITLTQFTLAIRIYILRLMLSWLLFLNNCNPWLLSSSLAFYGLGEFPRVCKFFPKNVAIQR